MYVNENMSYRANITLNSLKLSRVRFTLILYDQNNSVRLNPNFIFKKNIKVMLTQFGIKSKYMESCPPYTISIKLKNKINQG